MEGKGDHVRCEGVSWKRFVGGDGNVMRRRVNGFADYSHGGEGFMEETLVFVLIADRGF